MMITAYIWLITGLRIQREEGFSRFVSVSHGGGIVCSSKGAKVWEGRKSVM
jgi:hypothetical protein